jgi:S1-C subfamily serine protease
MIRFSCPACKKLLQAGLQHSGTKMACPGCGQRLQVPAPPQNKTVLGELAPDNGPAAGAFAPGSPSPAASPAAGPMWYYGQGTQRNGPVSWTQLQKLAASGALGGQALVWTQGMPSWVPAASQPNLFSAKPARAGGGASRARRPAGGLAWRIATVLLGCALVVSGLLTMMGFQWSSAVPDKPVPQNNSPVATRPEAVKPKTLSPKEIFAQASPSVALIRGKGMGHGSGFVVGPGLVMTNAHVTRDSPVETLSVHFLTDDPEMKNPIPVERVVYFANNRDLAVLKIKSNKPALKVARDYVFQAGEELVAIGSPGALGQIMKNGVAKGVLSTKSTQRGLEWYQVTMPLNGGNSGGPVFDSTGQVIGVVSFGDASKNSLEFIVPCQAVVEAVAQVEKQTEEEAIHRSSHNNQVAVLRRSFSVSLRAILDMQQALKDAKAQQDPKKYLAQFANNNAQVFQNWDRLLQGVKPALDRLASDPAARETYPKLLELWNTAQALKSLLQTGGSRFKNLDAIENTLNSYDQTVGRLTMELKALLKQDDVVIRWLVPQ